MNTSEILNPAVALVTKAADITGVAHSRIYSREKTRRLANIRWAIFYALRTQHAWTFAEIGEHFGCHYSNVMHGVKCAEILLESDKWFIELTKQLKP